MTVDERTSLDRIYPLVLDHELEGLLNPGDWQTCLLGRLYEFETGDMLPLPSMGDALKPYKAFAEQFGVSLSEAIGLNDGFEQWVLGTVDTLGRPEPKNMDEYDRGVAIGTLIREDFVYEEEW